MMKSLQRNKKAYFDYTILEDFEAGISLLGDEVKSMRKSSFSIKESYIRIERESLEMFVIDMTVEKNPFGTHTSIDPKRKRKLLMHKNQIKRISRKLDEKGLTLVPLEVYLNDRNIIKMKVALASGKKLYDKRETIKRREFERDKARDFKSS